MHRAGARKVKDKDGVWGTVVPAAPHLPSNAAQVVVQTASGQQFLVPTDVLVQQPDGSYELPLRLGDLTPSGSEHRAHQDTPMVVPVLVEELEVQKRLVETGKVRMTKVVHERETLVDGRSYWFGDRVKPNKASKRPLTQASLRCKRWLKPSSLHRIPTPLKRCWMSHLQALSTIPEPSGKPSSLYLA